MNLRSFLSMAALLLLSASVSAQSMASMAPTTAMDHGPMQMQTQMQMQGGTAPADARDPDAYSEGLPMGSGPHAASEPMMEMADQARFGSLRVDRLERGGATTAYDALASFGTTYDKFVIKAEGEGAHGRWEDARTELLWGHAVGAFWDAQVGLRNDSGSGRPGRNWLALGVQGLAPYWFELEATAYVGDGGRTALRLAAEYELLITQRLILQPRVEAELHGRSDPQADVGRGLATGAAGLRLRYEINRQFAPYIGVERSGSFGQTADLVRAGGEAARQTRWVAGMRFWF